MEQRRSTGQRRVELADAARAIIGQRFRQGNLTIDAVAGDLAVSRRTLQRALASATTDFSHEVHRARMELAARVLSLDYSVGTTARTCGYSSPSHFSQVFHSTYGITPSAFRKAAKLHARLEWRKWKDQIEPVRAGSQEYFRRRRRWRDDERELHKIVRTMPHAAQAALACSRSSATTRVQTSAELPGSPDLRAIRSPRLVGLR